MIKSFVHIGEHGKIIPIGLGAIGGLKRLQEILGIYLPSTTRERIGTISDQRVFLLLHMNTMPMN